MGVKESRTILMLRDGKMKVWEGETNTYELKKEIQSMMQESTSSSTWTEAPKPLSLSFHFMHFVTSMSFNSRYWMDLLLNATGMEMFILASSVFMFVIFLLVFWVGPSVENAPTYSGSFLFFPFFPVLLYF